MNEKTLLDPMAVLSAIKGKDDSGALILADDDWMVFDSVFQNIWLHADVIPAITEPLNEGEHFYAGFSPSRSNKVAIPCTFYIQHRSKDFNALYLIDMATTQLAKEIDKVRCENSDHLRPPTEDDLRYYFRSAISQKVLQFLFDEMPQTLVDLLGHDFGFVHQIFSTDLLRFYQLMYLLTEHKAGIGDDTFMYHHNYEEGDPDGPDLPREGSCPTMFFGFPVDSVFTLTDDCGDYYDWFYIREHYKLFPYNHLLEDVDFSQWKYLSFKEKGFHRAPLQKELITDCILSLNNGNLAEIRLARDILKTGLESPYWKGVWYPELALY